MKTFPHVLSSSPASYTAYADDPAALARRVFEPGDVMAYQLSSPKHLSISTAVMADDEQLAAGSVARLLITAATSDQVEVVARRIHAASMRAERPFVRMRGHELPSTVGALTTACADVFERAAGGSVLLADVEEIPRSAQELLIGVFERLARGRPLAAIRLVSGTTVSLLPHVLAGTFSAQLFYRLNVIHLVVESKPAGRFAS